MARSQLGACLDFYALEERDRRSLQDGAVWRVAGAVAGAVSAAFGGVPCDVAAEVRADGGDQLQLARLVAVGGDFARPLPAARSARSAPGTAGAAQQRGARA